MSGLVVGDLLDGATELGLSISNPLLDSNLGLMVSSRLVNVFLDDAGHFIASSGDAVLGGVMPDAHG